MINLVERKKYLSRILDDYWKAYHNNMKETGFYSPELGQKARTHEKPFRHCFRLLLLNGRAKYKWLDPTKANC